MNEVLFDYLNEFYTTYLDNILIYLDNTLEYENYIKLIIINYWLIISNSSIEGNRRDYNILGNQTSDKEGRI